MNADHPLPRLGTTFKLVVTKPEEWHAYLPEGGVLVVWRLSNGRWVCQRGNEICKVTESFLEATAYLEQAVLFEREIKKMRGLSVSGAAVHSTNGASEFTSGDAAPRRLFSN
jgi:hypothetical protein